MEATKVPLKEIKIDPLAHELATSEGTKPYLDCLIKAYRDNAVGLEAALEVIRDLPLEKAIYVAGIFRSQVGICRFRGRIRSTRPSPHS